MKTIFKLTLLLSIFFTNSYALQKETLKDDMSSKIEQALIILKNKQIDTKQKGEKIISILDDIFDYSLMGKLTLGKQTWQSISKDERKEFLKSFENRLKTSYIEKLELYTDQKVKILELVPYKKSRLQLQTELIGQNDIYKINYNFYYNKKKKEWFVYDVDLLGVSIVKTYQVQFSTFLKNKSFKELLDSLNKKENDK